MFMASLRALPPHMSNSTAIKILGFLTLGITAIANSTGPGQACSATTLCGGSGQRYQTIQDAANAAKSGQTVLVLAGTYAGFHSVHARAATAPITFKANSFNVTINSAGDSTGDCINIEIPTTSL